MTNVTSLDSLKVGGVNITKSAQAMTVDGAITIKSGLVTLDKAGVLAASIVDPIATIDDHKELTIVALAAQANTVTSDTSFGGGGAGKDIATFGGAIGDSLSLYAYQGKWYVKGAYGVTLS